METRTIVRLVVRTDSSRFSGYFVNWIRGLARVPGAVRSRAGMNIGNRGTEGRAQRVEHRGSMVSRRTLPFLVE